MHKLEVVDHVPSQGVRLLQQSILDFHLAGLAAEFVAVERGRRGLNEGNPLHVGIFLSGRRQDSGELEVIVVSVLLGSQERFGLGVGDGRNIVVLIEVLFLVEGLLMGGQPDDLDRTQPRTPAVHVIDAHPLFRIEMQNPSKKLASHFRQSESDGVKGFGDELLVKLLLGDSPPWNDPLEHLEEYDADGPSIAGDTVDVALESLRGHVDWRSDIVVLVLVDFLARDGEPEVPDFVGISPIEDIGWLDVPVQVPRPVHI